VSSAKAITHLVEQTHNVAIQQLFGLETALRQFCVQELVGVMPADAFESDLDGILREQGLGWLRRLVKAKEIRALLATLKQPANYALATHTCSMSILILLARLTATLRVDNNEFASASHSAVLAQTSERTVRFSVENMLTYVATLAKGGDDVEALLLEDAVCVRNIYGHGIADDVLGGICTAMGETDAFNEESRQRYRAIKKGFGQIDCDPMPFDRCPLCGADEYEVLGLEDRVIVRRAVKKSVETTRGRSERLVKVDVERFVETRCCNECGQSWAVRVEREA
jgi:predicted nucleic-acid-binding Zn-ribbon protein